MDYLRAIDPPYCEVQLAGDNVVVRLCPLLTYYRLLAIARRLTASDPVERLDAIFEYIQTATGMDDMSSVNANEVPLALDSILGLYNSLELLPWQQTVRKKKGRFSKSSADYENREVAIITNMLARAYGWNEEEIFSLQPDVAACYVQEILLDEWYKEEFEWKLSRVAYDAETGRYKPYPKLSWVIEGPTVEEATAMVPRRFMPSGVINEAPKKKATKGQDSRGEHNNPSDDS